MRFQKILRFTLGSRILAIKINAWNQELHTHYGITNETPDGYYIPFWDFDEKYDVDDVKDTLVAIQKDRTLGTIYIIQTYPKQSYRAVGFDVMDWQYYISTLTYTDYVDWSYVKHSVMRGRAVLRVSEKDGTENMIVGALYSNFVTWRTSDDHEQFFHSLFPHVIPAPDPPLKKVKVRLSKYESFR